MDINFNGKVAIVTGGTRGIGGAISEMFLKHGGNVVSTYRSDSEQAAIFSDSLNQFKENLLTIKADITDSNGREVIFNTCVNHFGRLDVLVNNAGVITRTPIVDMTEDEFDRILRTNLTAPYWLIQSFAKRLISRKVPGVIVNISSIDAFRATGCMSHYEISKAGLSMLTKSAATELAKYNIRVNTISPGLTQTDINRNQWKNQKEHWQERIDPIPMKRAAMPKEIANMAIFLASDLASYTTGADFIVDGGFTHYLPWYCKGL